MRLLHGMRWPELAARCREEIEAPLHRFVLIEHAGHLAESARPDSFLDHLRSHVRPVVGPQAE